MVHPCLSCGACCSTFRVSFYRGEAIPGPGAVPEALVEEMGSFRVAMRGTNQHKPRCVALEGTVGSPCRCTIYELRPSPCREFRPSWDDGPENIDCDRARIAFGLPALRPDDFQPSWPGRPGRAA